MTTFLISYRFRGSERSIEVMADSWEEAADQIAAIATGKVDGTLIETTHLCDECACLLAESGLFGEQIKPGRAN